MLGDKEYRHFINQVHASGLSRSTFIRTLIMGKDIKPRPPTEYTALLRELNAIGNNINQVAHMANTNHNVTAEQIQRIMELQGDIWQKVKGL